MKNKVAQKVAKYMPGAIVFMLAIALCVMMDTSSAMAQAASSGSTGGSCTTDPSFAGGDTYLLSEITDFVEVKVNAASQELFLGVVTSSGFPQVASAALTLFTVIFAVMFLFGLVPLTLGQAVNRGLKLALVLAVVSPAGWGYMNETVVKFFNGGSKEIIGQVIKVGFDTNVLGGKNMLDSHTFAAGSVCEGYVAGSITHSPFCPVDVAFGKFISAKTLVNFAGTLGTGPYGAGMGIMMVIGGGALIMGLIHAVKIYAVSLIAKALLFGLAPFFFLALLFERTKQMFTSWVSQLVNYSLQPILLFIFFSFYVVLLDSAIQDIMGMELCWADVDVAKGDPNATKWWRFCKPGTQECSDNWTWEGTASCLKNGGGACQDFPFSPVNGLIFLILSMLAYKFNKVVGVIATELSGATVTLDKAGRESFFTQGIK